MDLTNTSDIIAIPESSVAMLAMYCYGPVYYRHRVGGITTGCKAKIFSMTLEDVALYADTADVAVCTSHAVPLLDTWLEANDSVMVRDVRDILARIVTLGDVKAAAAWYASVLVVRQWG